MLKESQAGIIWQERNGRLHWLALLPLTLTFWISTPFAQRPPSLQTPAVPPSSPSRRPPYRLLRYDEDWSPLRDSARRTEVLDRIKYIPLGASGDCYLTIGGEVREQYERYDNPVWGQEPQDNNGYFLQRYMLHADLHMSNRVRAFIQIKSGIEKGRKGGPRPADEDELDINQAFVDVAFPLGAKRTVVLRAGRQEMLFGSGRFVGVRDGPNVRQSFDGVRAGMRGGAWRVDGFFTKLVKTNAGVFDDAPDHSQTFWGIYAVRPLKFLSEGNIDLYYLGIDRKRARFDQGTARERRHSIGMRFWGRKDAWDYNTEFVFQLGKFGDGTVRALAVASDTGYTLRRVRFRPRLGLKADVASGDRDGSDRQLQTFNTLFPRGQYFGEMALIGLANLIDLHPSLDFHLTDRFMVSVDWDVFWRESVKDGVYGNAINLLRSGKTSRARYIGSQPSLWMEWRINPHITFIANYTYFFSGSFLRETTPGRNMNYLMTQMVYRF
jgi:Alginate export